jgi:hypothetical protein
MYSFKVDSLSSRALKSHGTSQTRLIGGHVVTVTRAGGKGEGGGLGATAYKMLALSRCLSLGELL